MTILHVDASNAGKFENDLNQAIQRGSMIMLTGINWAGGEPWAESALENAGFSSATVFWPTSGAPILGVDFWEHGKAVKAIAWFNERTIDGNKLAAEFHQDTPPEHIQKTPAKASDSLPAPQSEPQTSIQRRALRFGRLRQLEPNLDWHEPRDPRRSERPNDILTTEAPHEDIGRFFPRTIEIYSRLFGGIPSSHGLVKIEGGKLVPTPEQAKHCVSLYKPEKEGDPKYLNNVEAAKRELVITSPGFVIPYPRGPFNGVGWGEFDKFTEWQLQGRKIEVDMLDKDLVFDKSGTRPLYFVSPAGEPQQEPIVVTQTLPDAEQIFGQGQTLSELLTNKRKRTETRGEMYGPSRPRGGRGGRGG